MISRRRPAPFCRSSNAHRGGRTNSRRPPGTPLARPASLRPLPARLLRRVRPRGRATNLSSIIIMIIISLRLGRQKGRRVSLRRLPRALLLLLPPPLLTLLMFISCAAPKAGAARRRRRVPPELRDTRRRPIVKIETAAARRAAAGDLSSSARSPGALFAFAAMRAPSTASVWADAFAQARGALRRRTPPRSLGHPRTGFAIDSMGATTGNKLSRAAEIAAGAFVTRAPGVVVALGQSSGDTGPRACGAPPCELQPRRQAPLDARRRRRHSNATRPRERPAPPLSAAISAD
jgi:hypothetical protein